MMMSLTVDVPSSADKNKVASLLRRAAAAGEGITITMPDGRKVDVDLVHTDVQRGVKAVRP